MLRFLAASAFTACAVSAANAQISPAAELRTYEDCLANLRALDGAYLQLSKQVDLIERGSKRTYQLGGPDDAPGLMLFKTMQEEPASFSSSWKRMHDALAEQCDSLWE
ncbi:hypothetical protein MACH17_11470 [Phaeobacter inhibens]|uniref:hypothetical protein n=1 Tax=Phaeobacter inhibens TaxID=221822 RepID=UPI00274F5E62|nr:hypothetical protein [Phaeobacter inhibens]GLO69630.1 hypothetical protein MACH17_11470 [Phaeobacter inhibens]